MSRPAPKQKGNFLQTLLVMTVVYLALIIFMPKGQNQPATLNGRVLKTTADYMAALQDDDLKVLEATAARHQGDFNRLVDEDVSKKRISQSQGDAEKIQGAVLVANATYKAGLIKQDTGKIRMAYQALQGYQRRMSTNPQWNQPVQVIAPDGKTPKLVTPQQEFDQIVDQLKLRNKSDLVYGIIPGGWAFIDFLVHMTGAVPGFSYAFAAFLLAFVVRAIVFPLAQKQYMHSRQMSQLMPRIKEIKDQYKDDQVAQNTKTMELYREYGINPFEGCLPAFIQMPLFLVVYQCMIHYQFQFQNGFFLWINPATSKATHGFVAPNLGEQDYILIVIYGITMLISTLLMPVTDPTQKTQQRIMGVGMAVAVPVFMLFGFFPVVSAFVLYWTFTNILSTAQAIRAYRMPLPPLVRVNTAAGGVYPSRAPKGKWAQMIDEMQQRMLDEQRKTQQQKGDDSGGNISNGSTNGKPKTPSNPTGKTPKNGSPKNGSTPSGQTKESQSKNPKYKPKKRA